MRSSAGTVAIATEDRGGSGGDRSPARAPTRCRTAPSGACLQPFNAPSRPPVDLGFLRGKASPFFRPIGSMTRPFPPTAHRGGHGDPPSRDRRTVVRPPDPRRGPPLRGHDGRRRPRAGGHRRPGRPLPRQRPARRPRARAAAPQPRAPRGGRASRPGHGRPPLLRARLALPPARHRSCAAAPATSATTTTPSARTSPGARASSRSPQSIVTAWMNSPGHRAVILDRDFRDVGVGIVPGVPVDAIPGATSSSTSAAEADADGPAPEPVGGAPSTIYSPPPARPSAPASPRLVAIRTERGEGERARLPASVMRQGPGRVSSRSGTRLAWHSFFCATPSVARHAQSTRVATLHTLGRPAPATAERPHRTGRCLDQRRTRQQHGRRDAALLRRA